MDRCLLVSFFYDAMQIIVKEEKSLGRRSSRQSIAIWLGAIMAIGASQAANAQELGELFGQQCCSVSAGYVWCHRTRECEQPWELVQSQELENSQEAFIEYCEGKDGALRLQWCASVGHAMCERTGKCESVDIP